MLVNGWAIALTICSATTLFLALLAGWCGAKVVRYWDHGADTTRQIKLEAEVWLTSALMKYALFCQVVSLLVLVLAADAFSEVLVGAMCATGAFLANDYGIATLVLKIVLVFVCGYWLLLNHLDRQSASYPLVKLKYIHLFFLLPLLVVDAVVQFWYLVGLEPDVLTSCCGVLFRPSAGDGFNLLDPYSPRLLLTTLYTLAVLLVFFGLRLRQGTNSSTAVSSLTPLLVAAGWLLFFPVSLWAITVFFSSYIYAMPSHRCPFDLLQGGYSYVGVPIYLTLFSSTFFGGTSGAVQPLKTMTGLAEPVRNYCSLAIPVSIISLLLFLAFTGYAPLRYLLLGGE